MPLRKLFIVATMLTLFSGCAGWMPLSPPDSSEQAEQSAAAHLLALARKTNNGLESYKGLGTLTIRQDGIIRSARAAWVGCSPDLLRFEIFGLPGQPGFVFSGDGRFLYLRNGNPPKVMKKRMGGSDLSAVLSVPLTMANLYQILAGKVPIRSHSSLSLASSETTMEKSGGAVLELKTFWSGVLERIHWNAEDPAPVAFEIFSAEGKLAYRVRFEKTFRRNGFRIPKHLTITDGEGRIWIQLKADRFWKNTEINLSVFSLKEPVRDDP